MRTTMYAIPLRLLRRQVEYVSHVRKMSLRDRARRAKSCCDPLMIEGVGVLMSACGLCSSLETSAWTASSVLSEKYIKVRKL